MDKKNMMMMMMEKKKDWTSLQRACGRPVSSAVSWWHSYHKTGCTGCVLVPPILAMFDSTFFSGDIPPPLLWLYLDLNLFRPLNSFDEYRCLPFNSNCQLQVIFSKGLWGVLSSSSIKTVGSYSTPPFSVWINRSAILVVQQNKQMEYSGVMRLVQRVSVSG